MAVYFPLDITEWPFIYNTRNMVRRENPCDIEFPGNQNTARRQVGKIMNLQEFNHSIIEEQGPPAGLSIPLAAMWWDAKGDWARAHSLVDELESVEGMAVHAYLHRKEGSISNADYWYQRSGRSFYRPTLDAERTALIEELLNKDRKA